MEGAELPGDDIADWIIFGDRQTGQLDKSNDRYIAAAGIMSRCEEHHRKAIEASRSKFLGIF